VEDKFDMRCETQKTRGVRMRKSLAVSPNSQLGKKGTENERAMVPKVSAPNESHRCLHLNFEPKSQQQLTHG